MQDRHTNRKKYFDEQSYTTRNFVMPYISEIFEIKPNMRIAEIGCGEGGNLEPFLDIGCKVIGVDLEVKKINNAIAFFDTHPLKSNIQLIADDIYKVSPEQIGKFDLIIMRDTIEHIPNQEVFLSKLKNYLTENGKVFIAFPPWRMPFGGHQQSLKSKVLNIMPYFHILPGFLCKLILQLFGEHPETIQGFMDIKATKLPISKFKRIIKKLNYKIDKETLYLINPNYEIKFKLKSRVLPTILNIPFFRDFITTAYYGVISL